MSYQAIVIGAGLSGAVMAERMASQLGWKVLVLEQRDHIGGNCFDEYDKHGVLIHRYGPHLFHTDSKEVWDYLSQFTEWLPYEHRVLSRIDGQLVPIPFNLTSIERCFPADKASAMIEALRTRFGDGARVPILELRKEQDPLLGELADFIYQKAFVNYTSKQWGVPPEQISPEVTARVPVVVSRDDRYFTDPWQTVPAAGYTAMFERMLAHPLIDVRLSTSMAQHVRLDWQQKRVLLDGEQFDGPLVYTGMLDHLLPAEGNYLPYRSLRFEHRHLAQEQFQPVTTVNYPNEEAFTRITEFKHFSGQVHPGTSIVYEYPCDYQPEQGLEPYYPLFTDAAKQHYQACRDELTGFPQLIALGRLAEYRYFDMDDAVINALLYFDKMRNIRLPLISVVMPVYNCEEFVGEAVNSIISQTFRDFEFIIIDDGSTDNTYHILQALSKQDQRIRLYRQSNKGLVYSLNKAIKLARGTFIARMDADDISIKDRFELQVEFMKSNPDVYILGGWAKLFGEINEVWHHRQDDNFIKNLLMFRTSGFQHSSVLIRKSVFDKYEYESQWPHIEDAALWCKIAANEKWKFHNLRCILVYYRTHHQQVSEIYREVQSTGFTKITELYVNQLGGNIGSLALWRKIIELSSMDTSEVVAAGLILTDIRAELKLPDEFFVIEERWLKICLANKVSHHLYKSHGPCRDDFVFLAESQLT